MHALHPTLAADCHVLGRLPSSYLLLHRNAALHWFILVPETGASIEACRDRARWEAAARAGRSVLVTYTVRGWQQKPDGPLWEPNLPPR